MSYPGIPFGGPSTPPLDSVGSAQIIDQSVAAIDMDSGAAQAGYPLTANGTGGATWGGDLLVTGNLTVNGTTTTVNSTVVDITDRVIHVNHAAGPGAPVPALITGFSVHRGDIAGVPRNHAGMFWDEAASKFKFAFDTNGDDATLSTFLAVQALNFTGENILLSGADKRFGATDAGTIYLAPFTNSSTAVQIRRADNVTAVLSVNTSIPAVTVAAVLSITGSGLNLASATSNNFINSDTSLAGVSGIASGRIRYNNTNGKWEVSTQASAYTRLVTASAAVTTVNRLTKFDATAEIANSNISDDGTSVTVLSGGASPSLIVNGTPGGDLQQWFNFATTLSVMDDTGRLILGGTAVAAAEQLRVVGDARIEGKLTVTGVIDPTAVVLTDPPATQELYYESADGQNASTSGANTGRIRYNDVTGTWQQSTQGNAYTDFGSVSGSGTTGKIPIWTSSTAQGDSSLTEGATIVSTKRIFPPGGAGGITLNALVADAPTGNFGEVLFQQDGTDKGSIYYQDFNGTKDVRIYSYVVADDIALFDVDTRDVLFYKKLTIGDSFLPYFNNTQNMGSSSMRWQKVFSQILRSNAIQDEGDINRIQLVTSGDLQLRDNTGAVNFSFSLTEATSSLNIIPNADNTYDLGSSTFKWKDGYFAGNVVIGGKLTVTGAIDPTYIELTQISAPSTPSSGHNRLYFKTGNDNLYMKSSAGAEVQVNSSFSAASDNLFTVNQTMSGITPYASFSFDIGTSSSVWNNVFALTTNTSFIKDVSSNQKRIEVPSGFPTLFNDTNGVTRMRIGVSGIELSDGAAIATTATVGHTKLPICAGTPTGVPALGSGSCVYDTSANKIWVYNGTWRGILVV